MFSALGGFSDMRFGEDIDLSTRLIRGGYVSRLMPEAWVWHKRRVDFRKFFRQVHNSGIARINLTKRHPGTLKLVHLLPAVFTVGCALLVLLFVLGLVLTLCGAGGSWLMAVGAAPLLLFALIIATDAAWRNRSLRIGLIAVAAAYVQLLGYGSGFCVPGGTAASGGGVSLRPLPRISTNNRSFPDGEGQHSVLFYGEG